MFGSLAYATATRHRRLAIGLTSTAAAAVVCVSARECAYVVSRCRNIETSAARGSAEGAKRRAEQNAN